MLNIGYIEQTQNDNDIVVRFYYDTDFTPVGDSQPLVDGPRGYCMDVTNVSGAKVKITVNTPGGGTQVFTVNQGDPVTSGQARSRTAAQVAQLGITTRGQAAQFSIEGQ